MMRHAGLVAAALVATTGLAEYSMQLNAQNGQLPANQRPAPPPAPPDPGFEHTQDAQAFDDLRSRAVTGDAEAQFQLGLHYRLGFRVLEDFNEAAAWFLRAAGQGHPKAQYELGILYQGQTGGPRDYVEAAAWLRAAAKNGHVYAMYRLGDLYANGRGVIRDPVLECMWYFLAAYRSTVTNPNAPVGFAQDAARKLTHVDRLEALRLAAEWDAAHPLGSER